ncbi:MAG: formylmethanofuran dehydrogenase subunit C [Gemmatimonadetes bacterium]|nr:MAG: formylmethanofuran dehydrogenase subunit C [Gemmatimonadota bacterium]PYO71267.1 MAG: formylmethanofuran dehydrogenase subunit C [Gemmatimonadota bacterium]TLY45655.1 MAG: formylmethanofuran dehydrogenase subunit C [Gemmatimonadota bacterium]
MSDVVTLVLTHAQDHALVADCIVPDRFAALTTKEIAALRVTHGGRPAQLGDFFTVTGARSTSVRVAGSLERVEGIGTAMAGGDILIDGAVGPDLGLGMAGGRIDVRGAAGDNAGGARPGAAKGMTGGEIIIRGSVGDGAGAHMRRGLLVVVGDGGRGMGAGMIAGTVVLFGSAGPGAGRFLKRGSIVALGTIERPATFRYACTYRPPHVNLLLRYLRTHAGVPVTDRYVTGRYERYSGDLAELGKGEILQWAGE